MHSPIWICTSKSKLLYSPCYVDFSYHLKESYQIEKLLAWGELVSSGCMNRWICDKSNYVKSLVEISIDFILDYCIWHYTSQFNLSHLWSSLLRPPMSIVWIDPKLSHPHYTRTHWHVPWSHEPSIWCFWNGISFFINYLWDALILQHCCSSKRTLKACYTMCNS